MSIQTQAKDESVVPMLSEQVCFALYTATHRIIRAYRPLLEPLGLTYVQYLVLLVLWENSPRSVGNLGSRLYLDSGTLTPLLKRMERSGFVSRVRDADDERRVLIYLTDEGKHLRQRANKIYSNMLCQIELSRPEARDLHERIMELADILE